MQFSSKILLFGEYAIIRGGEALALPLPRYGGRWAFADDRTLQQNLPVFADYLSKLKAEGALLTDLDTDAFEEELSEGLYFDSDIPAGYGVGSSGAVVAGVLQRFGEEQTDDLASLKKALAQMESFFHGASSGLDPLVSYLQKAVWIKNAGSLETVEIPPQTGDLRWFLMDTKTPRSTGPLVEWFLQQLENEAFESMVLHQLMPANRMAIAAFLERNDSLLWQSVSRISELQFNHFQPMIPENFRALWQEGLSSDDFKLKLCGAGGGGFILGLVKESFPSDQSFELFDLV